MRTGPSIPVLAAMIVLGAPVHAKAPAHPPRHHHAVRHVARRRLRHLSVEMRDDGRSASKSYASRQPGQLRLRPSVDTRFGQGAVASFGYHPGVVQPTLGPHELDGAAEPRLGHSESTAGVSVKVPL